MSSRIYISNIASDVKNRDIQDLFSEYGRIVYIDIHGNSGYLVIIYIFPFFQKKISQGLVFFLPFH